MKITYASSLSNDQLVAALGRLARGEREATVALVVHLAEFDARRLYRGAGFSSLFTYCVEVLHLSEDAACNRIESARVARRYPAVLDMLRRGE
ncbi:MAG TPA: HNH endonuclease, partial [Vicinamibacteria bacterium]|nr:HNH endonuclease [Vicinamibacteria bacterium]